MSSGGITEPSLKARRLKATANNADWLADHIFLLSQALVTFWFDGTMDRVFPVAVAPLAAWTLSIGHATDDVCRLLRTLTASAVFRWAFVAL